MSGTGQMYVRMGCLAAALTVGCSSPATSENSSDTFIWTLDISLGGLGDGGNGDASGKDLFDTSGSDANLQDSDTVDIEVNAGNCPFPANPAKGEPGASCASASDCDDGLCVDSPDGKICTVNCTACCPSGFKCAAFQSGRDPISACLPAWTQLCRPCLADADCASDAGALCVAYGGTGSFCAAPCEATADCPAGFACQTAQGSMGAGKQCVKQQGECACSEAATMAGAKTTCSVTNSAGTCSGTRKCTLQGLAPCPAATPAVESCDGADNDCNGQTDEPGAVGCVTYFADGDGDGSGKAGSTGQCLCAPVGSYTAVTATDCDDANAAIHVGAPELCDNLDNNCNGLTDDGCDDDQDGWCDASLIVVGTPIVCPKGQGDCDDTNAAIHPGQAEICGNGIDDNCDGLTDSGADPSGCVAFYMDGDGDGYGTGTSVCVCSATGLYTTPKAGDCNDVDPNVNPGKVELCGNGVDDNCNGQIDEAGASGCTPYFTDDDGDGYGVGTALCLCAPDATHTAVKNGDCDDQSSARHPGAAEICNGIDDDCDGVTDQPGSGGCTLVYPDADADGYGVTLGGICLCTVPPTGYASQGGDCNDASAAAYPGATEICDGLDNNCNGQVDEAGAQGCTKFYQDTDGDGFGDATAVQCLCAASGSYTATQPGDCNDQVAAISPAATETCDGIDNNCNGQTDEAGATGCTVYAADSDGDGFGAIGDTQCLCAASGVYTSLKATDCNDQNKAIHPGADEICDGLDNDCDGITDPNGSEGCQNWFLDKDGDGYGTSAAAPICACGDVPGRALLGGDCNDANAAIHPGVVETCNGVDDNCDGSIDPLGSANCIVYFTDMDQDGYGIGSGYCMCSAVSSISATVGGDCNDANPAIHPNATEVCNGVDDNCNGQTDEGASAAYYADGDGDGYGTGSPVIACAPPAGFPATSNGDCNDGNAAIHPGATEVCNGVDDNCNGQIDEGLATQTYYLDADKDGYGTAVSQVSCAPSGSYTATLTNDCNDGNAAIHPGATEVCNSVDDNCNGQVDEGLPTQTYYLDADKDGYGTTASQVSCAASGSYTATNSTDCNDSNAAVNPGHAEVCGNGVDDNCNGATDEGCALCLNTSNAMLKAQSGWKVYKNAAYISDGCELVPYNSHKQGQIYYTLGRIAAATTHIEFDAAIDNSGSDGFSLNIIDVANLATLEADIAAALDGMCLGFGVTGPCATAVTMNALHLKLDTHYNSGDKISNGYEFALVLNGNPQNYLAWADAWNVPGDIRDWAYHHYVVDISGTSFKASIDDYSLINTTLPSTFAGGFVGFSAATGSDYTEHEVANFSITQTSCP